MKKSLFVIGFLLGVNAFCIDEINIDNKASVINQIDVDEQNKISKDSVLDPELTLDDFFENFKDEFGVLSYGEAINSKNGGSKTFYHGRANCSLNSNSPDFIKDLQLTFAKAMIDMQGEFVKDTYGRVSNSINRTLNNDKDRDFEKLPPKKGFARLWNKIIKLTEAEVDQKLRQIGVELNDDYDFERKKELFADTIFQKINTEAFGNIKGLVPVRTAITFENGVCNIGVIAVMSSKTTQLAIDMKQKRSSIFNGRGKKIEEFISKDPKNLLNDFGIRMVYDEKGEPTIISYAQWGVAKDKNSSVFLSKKKIAINKAKAIADSQISDFVNSHIVFKEEEEQSVKNVKILTSKIKNNNKIMTEEDVQKLIDKTNSFISLKSYFNLKGIRTLKTWQYKDKGDLIRVGVVRYYKYFNVKDVDKVLQINNGIKENINKKSKFNNIGGRSVIINNIDDF